MASLCGPHLLGDRPLNKIAVVNGLRGLAIIGVLFQHIGSGWAADSLSAVWAPLFTNGWTGVNLFFILSGFVLFLPYASGRRRMAAGADAWHFYWRRCLRLMPLYYAAAVVLLVLAGPVFGGPKFGTVGFGELATDLATARFVLRPHHFGVAINYPLWSVGVEILFSLAFPAVALLVARLGMGRVLAAALVAAFVARVIGRLWDPHPLGPNFIADNIFGRIDEFVLGMAVAQFYLAGKIPAWARHLGWPGAALVLLAWAGFYQCQYQRFPMVAMAPLNNLLDLGFLALLVAALVGRKHRVLAFAPLQVAGMMCYSLYIWHAPVLQSVQPLYGITATLAVLLALSAISYRYIEFARTPDWRTLFLWSPRLTTFGGAIRYPTAFLDDIGSAKCRPFHRLGDVVLLAPVRPADGGGNLSLHGSPPPHTTIIGNWWRGMNYLTRCCSKRRSRGR